MESLYASIANDDQISFWAPKFYHRVTGPICSPVNGIYLPIEYYNDLVRCIPKREKLRELYEESKFDPNDLDDVPDHIRNDPEYIKDYFLDNLADDVYNHHYFDSCVDDDHDEDEDYDNIKRILSDVLFNIVQIMIDEFPEALRFHENEGQIPFSRSRMCSHDGENTDHLIIPFVVSRFIGDKAVKHDYPHTEHVYDLSRRYIAICMKCFSVTELPIPSFDKRSNHVAFLKEDYNNPDRVELFERNPLYHIWEDYDDSEYEDDHAMLYRDVRSLCRFIEKLKLESIPERIKTILDLYREYNDEM